MANFAILQFLPKTCFSKFRHSACNIINKIYTSLSLSLSLALCLSLSLSLSLTHTHTHYPTLLLITLVKSSWRYPMSAQNYYKSFYWSAKIAVSMCRSPWRTSLIGPYLLQQQRPLLVRIKMGSKWPYSSCFIECCS